MIRVLPENNHGDYANISNHIPVVILCAFREMVFNIIGVKDYYFECKTKILDPDRPLVSVLCVAFHDCSGLESVFKDSTYLHKTMLHLLFKKKKRDKEKNCVLLKLQFLSR